MHGDHLLGPSCWSSPVHVLARGHVWGSQGGVSCWCDMVVGQGEAHIELGSRVAMEVLGLVQMWLARALLFSI